MADIEIEKQRFQNRDDSGKTSPQRDDFSGNQENTAPLQGSPTNEDATIDQALDAELSGADSQRIEAAMMESESPSSSPSSNVPSLQEAAQLVNDGFEAFTDQYARASSAAAKAGAGLIGDTLGALENSLKKTYEAAANKVEALQKQRQSVAADDAALAAIDESRERTTEALGDSAQQWFREHDALRAEAQKEPSADKKETLKKAAIEAVDFIPFVGSAKMLTEAARGKTFQGKELSNKQRAIHALEGTVYLLLDSATLGTGGAAAKGGIRASKLLTRNAALARKIGLSRRLYKPAFKAGRAIAKNPKIDEALTKGLRKLESKRGKNNIDVAATGQELGLQDRAATQSATAATAIDAVSAQSTPPSPEASSDGQVPQQIPIRQADQRPGAAAGTSPTPAGEQVMDTPPLSSAEPPTRAAQEQQWRDQLRQAHEREQHPPTEPNIGRPITLPPSTPTRAADEETDETGERLSPQEQEQKWQEELRNQRMNRLRGPGREEELQNLIKEHIDDIKAGNLGDDEKKLAKILQTESGTDERRQAIREAMKVTSVWKSSFLTKTGTLGYAFALGLAILKDFGDGLLDFLDLGTVLNWLITTGVSIILWIIIHKSWIKKLMWQFRFIKRAKFAIKKAIARRLWLFITAPLVEMIPFINVFPSMTFSIWLFKRSVDKELAQAERDVEKLEERIKHAL